MVSASLKSPVVGLSAAVAGGALTTMLLVSVGNVRRIRGRGRP